MSNDLNIQYTVKDERTHFAHIDVDSSLINYRPYQLPAITQLIAKPEGVLIAPAGSGKTIMGLSLIPILGQPTLWLTHTGPLLQQAIDRAKFFFSDIGEIGVIGAGKWKVGPVLTVGLVQTLVRNLEQVASELQNSFGMVIVDEAHRTPSRTFLDVTGQLNSYYMYGLTATPYRRDKLENLMYQALGEAKTVIPRKSVEEHGGVMVPTIRYRAISSKRVEDNNIQRIMSECIVGNIKRNRIIVGDVVAEATRGHYCIVVSDRKEHCEQLHKLISAAWEKTGIATGDYSKKVVAEQVEKFNNKEITVLVATTALLGEGFDVPFLDRGFIAMPFRAEGKVEQVVGRIQRTAPGKKDAILYDYVDVDVGILKHQFHNKYGSCRYRVYERLGANIEPC